MGIGQSYPVFGKQPPIVQQLRLALAHPLQHLSFGIAAAQRKAVTPADLRQTAAIQQTHDGTRVSVKAGDAQIVVVDELALAQPKTRLMVDALNKLVGESTALVLIANKDAAADVVRATRNIPDAKILDANYLNIRDLLRFDKVVLPLAAIETISSYLG